MPTFEFKNYFLDLKIAGNDYRVNCVTELADKVRANKEKLAELTKQINAGTKTGDDAIVACQEIIDDILGAGAVKNIFRGRKATMTDCSDVLLFIVGEMTEQYKKQNPGNRATRRAEQKTAGNKK